MNVCRWNFTALLDMVYGPDGETPVDVTSHPWTT